MTLLALSLVSPPRKYNHEIFRVAGKLDGRKLDQRTRLSYTCAFCVVVIGMLIYHPIDSSSCGAPPLEFGPDPSIVQQ